MQRQDDIFLWVASKITSTPLLTEILQSQQNSYDIQPYKIEASDGTNMAKIYSAIKTRYEYGAKNDSDPDSWNENQRRLFVWFVVCYTYLLDQEGRQINSETWQELSPIFFNKKPEFLHFQYLNLLKSKGRVGWSTQEDRLLIKCTQEIKPGKWNAISKKMFYESGQTVFRTPKHCRERWLNHLDETKKRGDWTTREDFIIFEYANSRGKRWSKMVDLLDGTRTEHMIKNRYNSLIAKWRGPKKQKEEDVAKKILNMLTTAQQVPSQKNQKPQQKNNSQSQDKKSNNQRQISQQVQPSSVPPRESRQSPNAPGPFPFNYYMDYQSFLYYQHCCYQQFGYPPLGIHGREPLMFQPSKQSNFSSYKQQKAEDLN